MEFITNLDFKILLFLQKLHNPLLNYLMIFFSTLNNYGFICFLSGILLMFKKKYRVYGIMIIIATLTTAFVGNIILKNVFERPRPFHSYDINLIIEEPSGFSFPSGHTSSAFVCAGMLSVINKKLCIISYTVASLIAISRAYLFVHFPSDIIAGALLGITMSWIFIYLYNTMFPKKAFNLKYKSHQ